MAKLDDPRIRLTLLPYLLQGDPTLWVREEMGVYGCVADLVTVSASELHIYEIKSDVDTTSRLADRVKRGRGGRTWTRRGQITAYSAMADRVTLVVGTKLLEESMKVIPPWWGVLVAVDEFPETVMVPHRPALPNPNLRWANVFRLLWRAEALAVAEKYGVARGVRHASKARIKSKLKFLTLEQLRMEVRYALRTRVWTPYGS